MRSSVKTGRKSFAGGDINGIDDGREPVASWGKSGIRSVARSRCLAPAERMDGYLPGSLPAMLDHTMLGDGAYDAQHIKQEAFSSSRGRR